MENIPVSLAVQCLRSVVVNLTNVPSRELQYLPNHYQEHFRWEPFIQVKFKLWPRHIRGDNIILAVKKDMVISEVLLLLGQKLKLESDLKVQVFQNCLHMEDDDLLQTESGDYNCVFSLCKPMDDISHQISDYKQDLRAASNNDVSNYTVSFFRRTKHPKLW